MISVGFGSEGVNGCHGNGGDASSHPPLGKQGDLSGETG